MSDFIQFPAQQKSMRQKGRKWRKQCVDWGDSKTYFNYSPVRKSVRTKKINQDLVNGIIHMEDIQAVLNPSNTKAQYIPEQIQHFPIINSKLNVLRGEEAKRAFDWKVVVTNPNSISEIENTKKAEIVQRLQEMCANSAQSEEDFNAELEKLNYFFAYEWQDMRETRANALLTHYISEYNVPFLFNQGFVDGMQFGEEIYQVDIVGGEPILEKIDPLNIRIFRSGYSNRIEDADMIVLEDFWSPGKIYDRYYDALSASDMKYIEEIGTKGYDAAVTDSMDNIDERAGFVHKTMISDEFNNEAFCSSLFSDSIESDSLLPYDTLGNIRVTRVYWKSRRKVKKVKHYDPQTGETLYTFYPEDYILNTDAGEEEEVFWINEAWEGTKIGEKIYVNMRPRPIQYNRLSNPSRCHFGIIGSIYNINGAKPYSLVDMMKPYSYYYDAIHDRLNKLIEKNWGKIMTLDLAKVPSGWDINKWLYYAKNNSLAVINSFNEGTSGQSTGVLAGGMNNASSGVIDAELGNSIQQYLQLLEYIKGEMAEVAGISKQREGQISNRETVGGVERATLQSAHITEWLFTIHDDVKKRVLEAFLETAKIALRGRKKKFQYLLSDGQQKIMEIDGDVFAESDYGLSVDNSAELQKLNSNMDMLAQVAMQNGYSLSVIVKLFSAISIREKTRIIEYEEQMKQQQAQQEMQQQQQLQQQQLEFQQQNIQMQMQQQDAINQRDNETKILVAEINSKAEADRLALMNQDDGVQPMGEADRAKLREQVRQFDAKMQLEKQKLQQEQVKAKKDQELKARQIAKQKSSTNK